MISGHSCKCNFLDFIFYVLRCRQPDLCGYAHLYDIVHSMFYAYLVCFYLIIVKFGWKMGGMCACGDTRLVVEFEMNLEFYILS